MSQSHTISLNGLSPSISLSNTYPSISPLSLDDSNLNSLLRSLSSSEYVKRYEVIETTEDVLALSVAWKRLRSTPASSPFIRSLLDNDLFRQIEESDRIHANEIRDYFSKKIMLWSLKGISLSKYRTDLNKFIHGDSKKITEEILPIVYRLPEFYDYDIQFDNFKQDVKLEITNFKHITTHQKITTLKPITSFYKSNKRTKRFEYWLSDSNDNAHMITIEPRNPLKHIWDNMFTDNHLRIEAAYAPKQYDDLQYYLLLNWKLA